MNDSDVLRHNTPSVVHETIDGEVVIVNLDSGAYFGLDGSGRAVWERIDGRRTVGDLTADLARRQGVDPGVLRRHLEGFLETLRARSLVVDGPLDGDPAPPRADLDLDTGIDAGPPAPFAPPVLNEYTDMQDLLLLDPIHEVDEQGWPHALPGDGAGAAG